MLLTVFLALKFNIGSALLTVVVCKCGSSMEVFLLESRIVDLCASIIISFSFSN